MDQALGDVPFNSIRAVRQLDIGEALLFVYGYDDKGPDQTAPDRRRRAGLRVRWRRLISLWDSTRAANVRS